MKDKFYVDGVQGALYTVITRPEVEEPVGVILCLHGGPGGDHMGPGKIFNQLADIAMDQGYATVQFDMYGAGQSEGGQRNVSILTQSNDYRIMREFVNTQFGCPLHIAGESMGATIAALDWDETAHSYLFLWPAFDLRDTDLRPYFQDSWNNVIQENGYLDDNGLIIGEEFYKELLSYDFSECFQIPNKPFLLVHGRSDNAVPFEQSLRAFKSKSGPSEFHAHPDADHGFEGEVREFALKAIKGWLTRQRG